MLNKFFDTLANMGIWIRLNDNRMDPPTEQGREWGAAVNGFALSLASSSSEGVSVLMKNLSDTERRVELPDWLRYLRVEVTGPDGSPAPLKAYGRQVLDSVPDKTVERVFPAGKSLSTEVPVGALYDLHVPGEYRVRVVSAVPGGAGDEPLISNDVRLVQ